MIIIDKYDIAIVVICLTCFVGGYLIGLRVGC